MWQLGDWGFRRNPTRYILISTNYHYNSIPRTFFASSDGIVLTRVSCCPLCPRPAVVVLLKTSREVPQVCFFFFKFIPFIIFALLFSLPSSRNSDPGSHSRLFSTPTHYGSFLAFFFREKISTPSLVDSCRIVLTHARRSQQVIIFFFLIFANKFKISRRQDSDSRPNTSSIRGLPLVHRGDRLPGIIYIYIYVYSLD